ncbi:DUF6232 family protein [Streptomyces sp. NPDC008121]|uniref:DUF6232 family protein n=1 Tax=Streptomyces sp. NPDC008121 TaxID=3364809 RepID=UPI0036DFB502
MDHTIGAATPPQPSSPPPPAHAPAAGPEPWTNGIDIVISKRLLWVGGAAYPLQNIARVYTFTLHPRRKEAVVRFVKRVALTLALALVLTLLGGLATMGSQETAESVLTWVWLLAAAALVYSLVEMVTVLTAQSHFVLAVETSGPSTALVTAKDPEHLRRLVHSIAHAIENPETEFQVRVETLTISPSNYYFGDNVNMYGGTGNVGMAGA